MNPFFSLLKQHLIQSRILILVHLALGIAYLTIALVTARTSIGYTSIDYLGYAWYAWMGIAIILFVLRTPALGDDAQWRTRPIRPLTMAASKFCFLLFFFALIPAALVWSFYALSGSIDHSLLPVFTDRFTVASFLIFALAVPTTLTKNLVGALIAILTVAISGLIVTTFMVPNEDTLIDPIVVFDLISWLLLVAAALGAILFFVPYITRSAPKTIAAILLSIIPLGLTLTLYKYQPPSPPNLNEEFPVKFAVVPGTHSERPVGAKGFLVNYSLQGEPPKDKSLIAYSQKSEVFVDEQLWRSFDLDYDKPFALGIGGTSALENTLGVDFLKFKSDLYSTDAQVSFSSFDQRDSEKEISADNLYKIRLVGNGFAGLVDYQIVATFPAIQDEVGSRRQWKPSASAQLRTLRKTSKDQVVANLRILDPRYLPIANSYRGADREFTYALVIPDSRTAYLASSITHLHGRNRLFEEMRVKFDLPDIPPNSSIVLLRQETIQSTPFDLDLTIPKK